MLQTRKKKQEDWAKYMQRIEDAYKNDHRQLWQLVKRLTPAGKKVGLEPIRGANGVLAKSEEEILEAWAAHLEKLGTPRAHPPGGHRLRRQDHRTGR